MGKRRRNAIKVAILSAISGLIIWHAVHWHSSGAHIEMFIWLNTGRAYITVLYNLGLMLALGSTLAFLIENITELFGYRINETKDFSHRSRGHKR